MLQCILFDLDNTLYSKDLGIFENVVERIRNYMELRMGFPKELARELRQEYVKNYGSTLRGLMIHQNIDPEDYLTYVHDVNIEARLAPNPDLAHLLTSIPIRKFIFTSSHRPHALKVLRCLGVEYCFAQIFDIAFTEYIPKPNLQPYQKILNTLGMPGPGCMMVEDLPANLQTAKELGMVTVLLGESGETPDGFVDYQIKDILELRKVLEAT